jgi:hypothetical protein
MSSIRMLRPTLAAVVLVTACAANPPPKDTTMHTEETESTPAEPLPTEPGLFPRWRKGDTWDVHYRVAVPNPAKSASPSPRFEEHDWRYAVDEIGPGGRVHVSALALDEDADVWRMVFDEHGALLELHAPRDDAAAPSGGPLVPLSPGAAWNLTPAWPGFPIRPGMLAFEGGALTQQVTTDGAAMTVTLVRRGSDAGVEVERTVVQRWEPERPWWSTVRIDQRTTWKGETYETLELEGRVTQWTLAVSAEGRP